MVKFERKILDVEEWYEAADVIEYYKKLMDILDQDFDFDDIQETEYMENLDSGDMEVSIVATKPLGGEGFRGLGSDTTLRFDIHYFNQSPISDSDEGKWAAVQLDLDAKLVVDMPGSDNWLHSFLRRIWVKNVYRKQFLYWAEYTQEEVKRFLNETRAFFGLDPVVRKPRRNRYKPLEHSL